MRINCINLFIRKNKLENKKLKEIKFNYIKFSLIKKKFFIISLIIIYLISIKIRLSNDNNNNYYNTNSTSNKGFLKINTTHKGKFTYYDYASNIKVYKDLFKNISYTPIANSNFILQSEQISKEDFSKLCEEGILLDKAKYKRNINPKISVIIPYYIINKNLSITMALRSIQNQSLKDVEIILVDDGSLEVKINYVLNEMKDDNRIILLRHKKEKVPY